MNNKSSYVLQAFTETPWAIMFNKLTALKEIVERHVNGEKLEAEEIEARIHGAARPSERRAGSVAVLPLFGTIFPRANLMTRMSGATSAEFFGAQFAALINDSDVGAIVLDVNSPGGQVGGIEEVSRQIFEARGKKPIVAVTNHLMASAAYWIGSAADEIVISPSGDIGSIGVFAVHQDWSVALDKEGIKVSIIKEGKYKAEGNPYEPLSEEARGAIQARVSETYDAFVDAVARNRGVQSADVRNGFGEGRVVGAREAVKLGMADRIGTLDETISDLLIKNVPPASFRASVSDGPVETRQVPDGPENTPGETPRAGQDVRDKAMQEAQARLELAQNKIFEGAHIMNVRDLLNQRATHLARATELFELADQENRDFTDDERAEYEELLGAGEGTGKIGALDDKIVQVQADRAKLMDAAEKKFAVPVDGASNEPVKPEAQSANSIKRADYEKLDPAAKAAFAKGSGKIED